MPPPNALPPMIDGVNDEPWRICYRQLAPKLLLCARQWVASPADAEDVVQAAFVKFWKRQPDAKPEHYPLLFATLRTTALDLRRSQERRTRRESDSSMEHLRDDAPFFDSTIEQREDAALIEAALKKLPSEQREVLVLKIWGELTFAQIAETLRVSANTVASRHRYGLEALRKTLKSCVHE
jgi:RNA polymerase sigma-70 factor, ECF subfamily